LSLAVNAINLNTRRTAQDSSSDETGRFPLNLALTGQQS